MVTESVTKTCTSCAGVLPVSDFYLSRGKPRGKCKSCTLAANSKYRSANPEKIAESKKLWADKNREAIREKQRAKRAEDPEKYAKYQAEYYQANRGRIDAQNRLWVERNLDKHREYHREYVKRPEQVRKRQEWFAEYSKTEAAKLSRFKRKQNRRENLKVASTVAFTREQLQSRIDYFAGKCWMCGAKYEHIDHVKPISKGGLNILSNLRPACASCNISKGNRWPHEASSGAVKM